MSGAKVDRFCMYCRKQMRRNARIEMGLSVMTGKIAVCSKRCQDKWNDPYSTDLVPLIVNRDRGTA